VRGPRAIGGPRTRAHYARSLEGIEVATLRVDMQDGFQDDEVVVRARDQEGRKEHVTTMPQISYAGSIELEVEPGPVRLEISVPSRNLSASQVVEVPQAALHVGVSVDEGRISQRLSPEPFGYL